MDPKDEQQERNCLYNSCNIRENYEDRRNNKQ